MTKGRILAGLDAGHVMTKAVLMNGQDILGVAATPTGLDVNAAARAALHEALKTAGVAHGELEGIFATGIFRDMIQDLPLKVTTTIPDYMADAKGSLFLNRNSRSVIDMGGNIHKAVSYDERGNLIDVIQNDKCADGLGIFYSTMADALGVSEEELSELALKSTKSASVAIQCAASAESEAIDLLCQGVDVADVADAISRFIIERVAAMCTCMPLNREIVVAGGLAKSKALMKHLPVLLKQDVSVSRLPDYVGAIGAVMSNEGGK
ncbi:MAG: acyl-CoA dehydratase activase [Deltaproteobacteria bacterium]